ncbi:vesicle transport protein GOT1B isoform X1 [Ornithorhynchus anatinus]|uniref:Golgi transport 1B n=1 Tax=Ornithorhynchus anatinus TaxID=9258 RepID=A0A6I8MZ47_ORNAN|nr:vesicle transport protein GOT1B isoform X1 [Ornithorhynchus anatinus]
MISLTDSQKIGMGLTGFGVFFLFFGMILFFDKALLAIGNVLFVAGLAFVIGLERTFRFFFQKHKMKATGFFLGGVFVVLVGWPLIGMILEIYGFFLLFSSWIRSAKATTWYNDESRRTRDGVIYRVLPEKIRHKMQSSPTPPFPSPSR